MPFFSQHVSPHVSQPQVGAQVSQQLPQDDLQLFAGQQVGAQVLQVGAHVLHVLQVLHVSQVSQQLFLWRKWPKRRSHRDCLQPVSQVSQQESQQVDPQDPPP